MSVNAFALHQLNVQKGAGGARAISLSRRQPLVAFRSRHSAFPAPQPAATCCGAGGGWAAVALVWTAARQRRQQEAGRCCPRHSLQGCWAPPRAWRSATAAGTSAACCRSPADGQSWLSDCQTNEKCDKTKLAVRLSDQRRLCRWQIRRTSLQRILMATYELCKSLTYAAAECSCGQADHHWSQGRVLEGLQSVRVSPAPRERRPPLSCR